MIGASDQSRIAATTCFPSMSGNPRSTISKSGLSNAARRTPSSPFNASSIS